MEESVACDLSQVYEDLIRELSNENSPFLSQPQEITSDSFDNSLNNLLSNLYSGPTISDIETALLASSYTNHTQDFSALARISDMERGVSRVENKYILKIKSNGNVLADDGYKWRKYGQKSIKNSANPRNYYKCTNPRCGAKKQVQRSNDDPDTLIITYEGLHLHYVFPYFIFGQSKNPDPPTKKSRKHNVEPTTDQRQPTKDFEESIRHDYLDQPASTILTEHEPQVELTSQGLLEDMVPLLIRNPIDSFKSCSSPSPPSPTASPSCSWSPNF
ncbi:putative WRKY transcription factor 49 [Bidens hawaiensis]|uniref:putative WRKY transcription factor 49 n=1 Tax=Bidens hawaiensis TaxID=980011 RepID=UPI004049564F